MPESVRVPYRQAVPDELPPGTWDRLRDFAVKCDRELGLQHTYTLGLYTWASFGDLLRLPNSKLDLSLHEKNGHYNPEERCVWLHIGTGRSEADLARTLAHELRHAYQHKHGQDIWSGGLPFEDYWRHPAEVDAREWAARAAVPFTGAATLRDAFADADRRWERERAQRDVAAMFARIAAEEGVW
jgi:hypothetical protein